MSTKIEKVHVDGDGYVKGTLRIYGDVETKSEKIYMEADTGRIASYSRWGFEDMAKTRREELLKEKFIEVVTDGDGNWAVEGTYAAGEATFLRAYYHFPTQDERLAEIQERLRGFSNEW